MSRYSDNTRDMLKLYESMYYISPSNFNNPNFDNRFTLDDLVMSFELWIVNINIEIDKMLMDDGYSEYNDKIQFQKSNLDLVDEFLEELSIESYRHLVKYQVFIRTQLITISRQLTTITQLANGETPSIQSMSILSSNQKLTYESMDKMLEIQSKLVDSLYDKIVNRNTD